MSRSLRPYQEQAVDFLTQSPIGGLFMDMGLGKTAAVLHALRDKPRPILLVGPIQVIEEVWEEEQDKWEDVNFRFSLVRGKEPGRVKALKAHSDIYMTNPEMLPHVLPKKEWQTLVIDESSMFKNPKTKRFKEMRKYVRKIPNRYLMTGTPRPNSLLDLWSQMFLLDLGERLETSYYRFRNRYFYATDFQGYKWEPKPGARERILEAISDLVLVIKAEDHLEPRERVYNDVWVELPATQRKQYHEMERGFFTVLGQDQTVTATIAVTASMKLRQLASGFVYDDDEQPVQVHDKKIQALKRIIDETGSPIIVVYQFKHELRAIQKAIPEAVSVKDPGAVKAWNRGEIPVLLLHPASAGHGLNLQHGGHTMAVFSGSYSYEQMTQTFARIDRQGQEHPVIFHFIMARNTIDEALREVTTRKEGDERSSLQLLQEYRNGKSNRT